MFGSSGYHSIAAAERFSEGQRLLRAGDYEAAVQQFSSALTFDPDHWTAYFRRSKAYRHLGLEERANADLDRAEFLMAAARREAAERGDISGWHRDRQ